jgi:hypothetical protein
MSSARTASTARKKTAGRITAREALVRPTGRSRSADGDYGVAALGTSTLRCRPAP